MGRFNAYHTRLLEKSLQLGLAKVRHTNRLGLARLIQLLHSLVSIDIVRLTHAHLPSLVLWERRLAPRKRRRPMHQIQINIIRTEILQTRVKRRLNIIGVMRVIPQLGGYEDLLPRNTRLLDSLSDSRLGAIDARSVDMSVAALERSRNRRLLSVLVLPRSETDGWDGCTRTTP